jgi:hypothetical protein
MVDCGSIPGGSGKGLQDQIPQASPCWNLLEVSQERRNAMKNCRVSLSTCSIGLANSVCRALHAACGAASVPVSPIEGDTRRAEHSGQTDDRHLGGGRGIARTDPSGRGQHRHMAHAAGCARSRRGDGRGERVPCVRKETLATVAAASLALIMIFLACGRTFVVPLPLDDQFQGVTRDSRRRDKHRSSTPAICRQAKELRT